MNISTLSFNIHKGFNWSNSSFTLHQLKEQIQSTNVDIVFLQEVHGEQKKHEQNIQNWPQESQFEFLADGVWQDYAYAKNAVYDEGDHGNAILSRFPIVFNETINISTNPLEKRGILHCKIENPDTKKSLHLFCVHLNLTHKGRLKQYETIIERIKNHVDHNESFILAGDFNDWNQGAHAYFCNELGCLEAFYEINGEYAKSFPSVMPFLKLDRVYVKNIKVKNAQVLKTKAWKELSDHLPLLVELDWEKQ